MSIDTVTRMTILSISHTKCISNTAVERCTITVGITIITVITHI